MSAPVECRRSVGASGVAGIVRIIVCALLLGSLVGCSVVAGGREVPRRHVIAFAGDSITVNSYEELRHAATVHGDFADVYAFPGLRSAQIDGMVQKALLDHPDASVTVLNAGTNDVSYDVGPSWRHDLELLLAHATTPCVVLTTVNEQLDGQRHTPTAREVNAFIKEAVRTHDNYQLVDWDAEVRSGAPVLLSDGIHPNHVGRRWIADHDLAAVHRCDG